MSTGVIEVSEEDKRKHKEVEKELKEVSVFCIRQECRDTEVGIHIQAKAKMQQQVKVIGSVD
jgi:hypothetical protein